MAFRVARTQAREVLESLWAREMPTGVYDPRWLDCETPQGPVQALAFTLSRRSPHHTGNLSEADYRRIFAAACGRYGTTLEYTARTFHALRALDIHDRHLARLLQYAPDTAGDTARS